MNPIYQPLFSDLELNNHVTLKNRLAMCPMLVFAANPDGTPSKKDLAYFQRRNQFGQLLITGATAISKGIKCGHGQLAIENDEGIAGFAKLAQVMKANGSKAIVQIQHPGREAAVGYAETGKAYAPSAIDFPFLKYPVVELTNEQIEGIIKDFGRATQRLIQAGFDGVEIHGANHYLIQQFFSAYSNHRTDFWGGSLEKRMNFALAVTKEVLSIVQAEKPDFIVGYRISPEEVHGENVGYTIDESLQLIDKLADLPLDYIHTSTYGGGDFGKQAYKLYARKGNQTAPINTLIRDQINGRTAFLVSGSVKSADEALDAMNYGDLVGMGVAALSDPDFSVKIANGQEQAIDLNIENRMSDLALPDTLIAAYHAGAPFPPLEGLK